MSGVNLTTILLVVAAAAAGYYIGCKRAAA